MNLEYLFDLGSASEIGKWISVMLFLLQKVALENGEGITRWHLNLSSQIVSDKSV